MAKYEPSMADVPHLLRTNQMRLVPSTVADDNKALIKSPPIYMIGIHAHTTVFDRICDDLEKLDTNFEDCFNFLVNASPDLKPGRATAKEAYNYLLDARKKLDDVAGPKSFKAHADELRIVSRQTATCNLEDGNVFFGPYPLSLMGQMFDLLERYSDNVEFFANAHRKRTVNT